MSLITEINRTETEKEKVKKVATQIDNKLVELGGEQAINLADVPNKIGAMVKENYKKIALGEFNKNITLKDSGITDIRFPINFNASRLIVKVISVDEANDRNDDYSFSIDTKKSRVSKTNRHFYTTYPSDPSGFRREVSLVDGNILKINTKFFEGIFDGNLQLLDWIAIE